MGTVILRAVNQGNAVTLRGFFIQGRSLLQNSMVGTFADPSAVDAYTQLGPCPMAVSVTHNNNARMNLTGPFVFNWTAPEVDTGPIWFRYTVVQSTVIWWANDPSDVVQEGEPE